LYDANFVDANPLPPGRSAARLASSVSEPVEILISTSTTMPSIDAPAGIANPRL
jgi:hypothetical protein